MISICISKLLVAHPFSHAHSFAISLEQQPESELDSLKKILDQATVQDTLYVQHLLTLAAKVRADKMEEAIALYTQAITLSQQLAAVNFEIKAHNGLGICYGMHDQYLESIQHFNSALKLALANDHLTYAADHYNNLGIIYKSMGDYPVSLSYYAQSMHLYDSLAYEPGIASSSDNMGILFDLMKEPEEAIKHFQKALEIYQKHKDATKIAHVQSNMALLYLHQKDFQKATAIYESNLEYFEQNNMRPDLVQEKTNLGDAYYQTNAYDQAEVLFASALQEAEELQMDESRIHAIYGMAKISAVTGRASQGIRLAKEAKNIADSLNSLSLKSKSEELLSFVFQQAGQWQTALMHYQQYKAWEDSIFNENTAALYTSQQVQMEVAQKDRALETQALELAFLNEQIALENRWKWSLGIASVLLLLAGLLYYQKYRIRNAYSSQLEVQNHLIGNQKVQIESINLRLQEQIALRKETDDTINYFASSLFGKNTVDEILWDVAKNCIARLGLVDCVIYLVDEAQGILVQKAAYGSKNPKDFEIYNPIEIPIGQGIVGAVAQQGEAEMVNDTSQDERYIMDDETRLAELAVPIKYQDRVIGVIDSEHPEKGFFTQYHLDSLKTIAAICASKIAQTQADEEAQKAEKIRLEAEQIKALDLMKSHFFANISHEFRTPLNLILGPLRAHGEHIPAQELGMMQRNAQRLLRLVNQLMDLSRLEVGALLLEYQQADVLAFVRNIAASFASLAEEKGITYQIDIPSRRQLARFDPDKLEKIVYNLLSNAIKFTPKGGKVSVHVAIESSHHLRLAVSDTGLGIPEALQDKIFDRFYQVDHSNTRSYEGTGIGLALTKELVDLYQGSITIDSEVQQGTSFIVLLPLSPAQGEWVDELHIPLDYPTEGTAMSLPENTGLVSENQPLLLIVEDNADLRSFIRSNLGKKFGYREARDGKEGWELALEYIPDLIVTDVMMPSMEMPGMQRPLGEMHEIDGVELTRRLKTDERTSHIPVIMLTARDDQQTKLEGFQKGADQYVTKPFDIAELRERIESLLRQRKHLREKYSREIKIRPSDVTANDHEAAFLERCLQITEAHLSDAEFSVEQLQREIGMSRMQLHRKLKALTNQSATEFMRDIRLQRAAQLLQQTELQVAEVAYDVGFNHLSYFAKCFKEKFGVAPSDYAKKAQIPPDVTGML